MQKLTARSVLGGSVLEPYPEYRMAIGVLGVMLPPLVVFGNASWGLQNSISAYYYTPGRDWFVGILWVIGVFLFFYRYTPKAGRAKSNMPHIQSGLADACLGKIAVLDRTKKGHPDRDHYPSSITQSDVLAAASVFFPFLQVLRREAALNRSLTHPS